MPSHDRVAAKVTFVVHGGEVLAIFRAIRDEHGKWLKEHGWWDNGVHLVTSYAHSGQHSECDDRLLKCRRATYEEYAPLLAEMRDVVGYDVEPVQHGKLKLREEIGYAACWLDEYDSDFGVYEVFHDYGAALDYLTDTVFERAKLLGVDVVDQGAEPVADDNGDRWFPKMTWQQVRDQLESGMDFGLVIRAGWEYGSLSVEEQTYMGIRKVTIG